MKKKSHTFRSPDSFQNIALPGLFPNCHWTTMSPDFPQKVSTMYRNSVEWTTLQWPRKKPNLTTTLQYYHPHHLCSNKNAFYTNWFSPKWAILSANDMLQTKTCFYWKTNGL